MAWVMEGVSTRRVSIQRTVHSSATVMMKASHAVVMTREPIMRKKHDTVFVALTTTQLVATVRPVTTHGCALQRHKRPAQRLDANLLRALLLCRRHDLGEHCSGRNQRRPRNNTVNHHDDFIIPVDYDVYVAV